MTKSVEEKECYGNRVQMTRFTINDDDDDDDAFPSMRGMPIVLVVSHLLSTIYYSVGCSTKSTTNKIN